MCSALAAVMSASGMRRTGTPSRPAVSRTPRRSAVTRTSPSSRPLTTGTARTGQRTGTTVAASAATSTAATPVTLRIIGERSVVANTARSPGASAIGSVAGPAGRAPAGSRPATIATTAPQAGPATNHRIRQPTRESASAAVAHTAHSPAAPPATAPAAASDQRADRARCAASTAAAPAAPATPSSTSENAVMSLRPSGRPSASQCVTIRPGNRADQALQATARATAGSHTSAAAPIRRHVRDCAVMFVPP